MFAFFRTRLPLAAAVCLALAAAASAQTKVAVINLQKAVVDTAEIKKASAALEAKYRPRQEQMDKLQKEIQSLQQQLQNLQGKLTQQAEQDMVGQGQKKQRDLQRISEDLQADVDRERTDILNRSGLRMTEVVKKLAEEKGYDLVVEISNLVYFKTGLEITTDATVAYDKTYPVK
ncbi:MAG: OmpH family outer membrane protein [Acidobacteria bacterium]|nr:OmpH family outer membrane protein [Acidobacteriota bacterium]